MNQLQSDTMITTEEQVRSRRWKPRDRREGVVFLVTILSAVIGTRLAIDWNQSAGWPIWATALAVLMLNGAMYAPWYLWQRWRNP